MHKFCFDKSTGFYAVAKMNKWIFIQMTPTSPDPNSVKKTLPSPPPASPSLWFIVLRNMRDPGDYWELLWLSRIVVVGTIQKLQDLYGNSWSVHLAAATPGQDFLSCGQDNFFCFAFQYYLYVVFWLAWNRSVHVANSQSFYYLYVCFILYFSWLVWQQLTTGIVFECIRRRGGHRWAMKECKFVKRYVFYSFIV